MIRANPHRAELLLTLPTAHGPVLATLVFDAAGQLVDAVPKRMPPPHETAAEREAALLLEGLGHRLRREGSTARLLDQARAALDLIEQLDACQALHGQAARDMLAPAQAPR
jgi:hypothetical protein